MDKKVTCDIKISRVSIFREKIMFQMGPSQDNNED